MHHQLLKLIRDTLFIAAAMTALMLGLTEMLGRALMLGGSQAPVG